MEVESHEVEHFFNFGPLGVALSVFWYALLEEAELPFKKGLQNVEFWGCQLGYLLVNNWRAVEKFDHKMEKRLGVDREKKFFPGFWLSFLHNAFFLFL